MPPIDEDLEDGADDRAQQVVDYCAPIMAAGHALLPDDEALFELAQRYRTAKRTADNHREFDRLTESEVAEEIATRRRFMEAYKAYQGKKHQASA